MQLRDVRSILFAVMIFLEVAGDTCSVLFLRLEDVASKRVNGSGLSLLVTLDEG